MHLRRIAAIIALALVVFANPDPEPGMNPNPELAYCEQIVLTPYGPVRPFGC